MVTTCAVCGAGGLIRTIAYRAKPCYCSNACKVRAFQVSKRASNPLYRRKPKSEWKKRQSKALTLPCQHCGRVFRVFPGRQDQKACSRACANNLRIGQRLSRVLHKRACRRCGAEFMAKQSRVSACDKCRRREHRSISKGVRRAKMRGVNAESVNPLKVFARDGWRCQLCNGATPGRLRGTLEPNAPELDHIVPISKGGSHTYANTQCACRRCNGVKGANVVGQLRLSLDVTMR